LSLMNWAATEGSAVIEDDYDSEYRYFGRPLAALQSLDRAGCVIYVGTFTKMLFNALRLGFLVLPAHLVEPFAVARTLTDRHPPTLDQAILAEFILDGTSVITFAECGKSTQNAWKRCATLRISVWATCCKCRKLPRECAP
jgi:DNA-binding transcriptional MocR family regulator